MATLKKTQIGFQDQLSLYAGQKYCRMPKGEHSTLIYSTFIYLPFVIKIYILSILSGTGFTVKTNQTGYFQSLLEGKLKVGDELNKL